MGKKNNYTKWERDEFLLGTEPKGIGYPRDCVFKGEEYHPVLSTRVGWRKNREWLFRYAKSTKCFAPGSFLTWRDHWPLLKKCFGRHLKPVISEFVKKFGINDDAALAILGWDVTGQSPYDVPVKTRYLFEGFFESLKEEFGVRVIRHPWPNKFICAEKTFGDPGVSHSYSFNVSINDNNHLLVEIGKVAGWWIDTNTEEVNKYGACEHVRPEMKNHVVIELESDDDYDRLEKHLNNLDIDDIYLDDYMIGSIIAICNKWRRYYEGH